jgi:hypothetical protein
MQQNRPVIGRREFLGITGAAGAAAGLAVFGAPSAAAEEPTVGTMVRVVNGGFENGLDGWRSTRTWTPEASTAPPVGSPTGARAATPRRPRRS